MTAPEEYTRQQAADPSTPQQVLADIAALREDLRPVVALNPAAYPGLLDWLASLGEPGVDAALAQRRDRGAGAVGSLGAAGRSDDGPPWQVRPGPDGAGPGHDGSPAPGAPWAAPEAPGGPMTAAMPVPAGGPFATPPPGAGGGAAPQRLPGYTGGFPGPGGPGRPPGGFQGAGQAGLPAAAGGAGSGSRKALWIVLGVLGALLVAGVVVVLVVVNLARGVADELEEQGFELGTSLEGQAYGDNPELDALWDACADGDMAACDELYLTSERDSEYETFGDTCGGRTDGTTFCEGSDATTDPAPGSGVTGGAYGDDPVLDALWDACAAEDMQACDDLYFDSPSGSEYEDFGDTCGGRTEGGALCESAASGEPGVSGGAETYGDDPALDALWDACAAGDLAACDELYFSAGIGTEYEEFGETCGRTQDGFGLCAP